MVRISGGGVRLGIEAPSDIAVVREEVLQGDQVLAEKALVPEESDIAIKKPK